jgi:hypothetical protein
MGGVNAASKFHPAVTGGWTCIHRIAATVNSAVLRGVTMTSPLEVAILWKIRA